MGIVELTPADLREAAQNKMDKKYEMTDRMCSLLCQSHMHLDKDELKEAIKVQNELIMLLITETRKLS